MHPEIAPLTPNMAKELAALEQEHDTLETAWDANDERLGEISDRIEPMLTYGLRSRSVRAQSTVCLSPI